MKEKHFQLIRLMLDAQPYITSTELAGKLGVSKRSIKNYMTELNQSYPGLITSSNRGYQTNAKRARSILGEFGGRFPSTPAERIQYVLKRLLTAERIVDINDISDEIYVSYETIKKDIIMVRKRLKEFDLFLETTHGKSYIEGNESDKRRLLSTLLYEEFNENVLSLSAIDKVFPGYDIDYLHTIILETCKEYHYFINQYALFNLALDIVISIDRIRNNFTFASHKHSVSPLSNKETALVKDIVEKIEQHYEIKYNELELNELATMLISNLMKIDFNDLTMEKVRTIVGDSCMDLIEQLKMQMQNFEYIDIENEEFMVRFTIHISNLLLRLQNRYITKNPLTEHIKSTCPLIFECAVALSEVINQVTGYYVDEHETAYIALHIGALLSTHISTKNKIVCVVIFPQYYDYATKLIDMINGSLSSVLVIKSVVTTIEELDDVGAFDFVISTVKIPESLGYDVVMINPFLTDRSIDNIQNKIERIKFLKKREKLREQLQEMSNPDFFVRNHAFTDEEEAIRFMCDKMTEEKYVHKEFVDEVLSREKSYSTLYGNIAVPHSMKMNAKKTGMFVLINEKPFRWGDGTVNIVLLFAVKKESRGLFYDIFDNLIVLLLEAVNAKKIINCHSYEDFIERIIDCF